MATWAVLLGTYAIGTKAAISAIKVMTSKRISEHPIIRSDTTVIPEGKQNSLRIDLVGTLVGTGYTNFRDELKLLRGAADGTTQNFQFDDERYIRVKGRSFDYSFIKQDFCNYNLSLIGEMPYFLAVVDNSSIQGVTNSTAGGISSGTAFNLNNAGDVQIPIKIIFTGAGAATIADNIQFENVTLGTLLKFRGILQITSSLVIDLGYGNNNVPQYTVTLDGVNAMSAFEGDFMELAAGTNSLKYTGAAAGTVSIYYRKGYQS